MAFIEDAMYIESNYLIVYIISNILLFVFSVESITLNFLFKKSRNIYLSHFLSYLNRDIGKVFPSGIFVQIRT